MVSVLKKNFKKIKKFYKNMNKISKIAIKYGTVLIFSLYALAAFCFLKKGLYFDYYVALQLTEELLYCASECIGAVYVTAIIMEIVYIASGESKQTCQK